ncbi:CGNR zinc finger domain-containing protein [Micrococcus terreus]|uniref:CGNR zinc finger domain-containing protein n=1 Tax=Micrococcus terreus TaxID=574650 RepID=UPI0030190B1E
MLAPDLAARLHDAARLINTASGPRGGQYRGDQLATASALSREFPDRQLSAATSGALDQIHRLRTDLTQTWARIAEGTAPAAVQDTLNALLQEHGPVQLSLQGPDDATHQGASASGQWVLGGSDGPAAERFIRDLVLAVAEAAVAGELGRLRVCAGTDCANALVDVTRNSSKQFCDEANCANRTHVRAYRKRRASGQTPASTPAPDRTPEMDQAPATSTAAPASTPSAKSAKPTGQDEEAAKITRKIRKLSTRLQDPELSTKDRKKVAKKFKKLRKKLKGSANAELLNRLPAAAVK